jgi:hypothetical protein
MAIFLENGVKTNGWWCIPDGSGSIPEGPESILKDPGTIPERSGEQPAVPAISAPPSRRVNRAGSMELPVAARRH